MAKTKHLIYFSVFLGIFFLIVFSAKLAKAEETTFPADEAGIAAYVKLDSVDITDLTEALNFFEGDRRQGETYVIGQMKIENAMGRMIPFYNYPHLYIGLDGWIVAYYLKDEEASQIMQWKDYTPGVINTTTLKDAIDLMAENIGVTYPEEVKYYDFEFPEANKLTLIAETLQDGEGTTRSNSFSLTIPGTLHEASYSIYYRGYYYQWKVKLTVDGVDVFTDGCDCEDVRLQYGFYEPLTLLETNVPHLITLSYPGGRYVQLTSAATVLIYQN